MGPQPPQPRGKPDWVRILEEDAAVDEEVAQLLEGTGGDPDKIRAKMQQKLASPIGSGAGESMFQGRTGSDVPPRIQFREVDVFDLWVWLELAVPPSERERELLAACVRSWFVVGKLGGYNSQNLQVYYSNSDDNSFLDYDASEASSAFSSLMHECSEVEFKGSWARFHLDMGTADELAFDILLNMLAGFSAEVAGITQIFVGGEHERWAVPAREEEDDDEAGGSSGGRGEHGAAPRVGMNPMKLPQGLEEELALLEEVGEIYNQQQQQQPGGPVASPPRGSSGSGGGGGGQQQQQGLRPAGMQPIQPLQRAGSSSGGGAGVAGAGGGAGGRAWGAAWGAGISSRRPAAGGAAGSRTRLQQIQQQRQQRLEAGGAAGGQEQQQQGAGGGAATGKGSRGGRSPNTPQ